MGRREEETAARRHDRHKASPSPLRGEEDEEAIRNRLRESGWRKRRADGENAPAAESLLDKEKALDRPEKSSPRAPDDRRSARASRRSRSPRRRDRERRSSRRKASASRRRSPSRSRSPASRSRSRSRTRSRSAGRRRHRHSSSSRKRRSSRSKSRSRDAKRSKRTSSRSASAAKHKNSLKEEKKEEKKKEGKDDDETETENEDVEKEKKDERHKPSSSSRKSRRSRSGSPSSPSRSSRRRRHRRNASHSRSASRSRRSRRGSSRSRSRSPRDRRSRGRDRRRRRYSRSRSPSYNRRRRRTARSSSRDRRRETNSSPEPHQHPPAATEAAPPAPVAPASAAPAPTGVNPTITQLMAQYPTMSLQDIIAKMQASNVTMAAAVAQKPARELYVGNLPPNVTGPQLQEFLSTIIQQVGLTTQPGNPIVNTWISTDGHFAFCEMRSVEECNLALLLNQLSLLGQPLKFGRPRSFMGPPQQMPTISARAQTALVNLGCTPNPAWFAQSDVSSIGSEVSAPLADVSMLGATLAATSVTAVACANGDAAASPHRLIMSNIPIVLAEDQVKELVEPFGALKSFTLVKDTATGVSMGSALFQYEDDAVASQAVEGLNGLSIGGILLSVQRQPPGVAAVGALSVPVSNPEDVQSPVLKMANMISVDELRDDEEYADLAEDVEEECKRFGEVTGMEIPRPKDGGDVPGLGCIYVRFGKEEDSVSALKALNGRKFGGNIVKVTYFPLDKFEQRELS